MTTNIYRVLPYYVQGSLPSTLWSSTLIFLTALRGVYQVLFTPTLQMRKLRHCPGSHCEQSQDWNPQSDCRTPTLKPQCLLAEVWSSRLYLQAENKSRESK